MAKTIARAGGSSGRDTARISSRGIGDSISGATASANKAVGQVKDSINNAIASASAQVTDLAASAKSALGGSIDSITSSVQKISGSISGISMDGGMLSSLGNGSFKGPEETLNKIKQLGSDASEAIAKPIAFVSKAVNDVIDGNDGSIFGNVGKSLSGALGGLELDKLASSVSTIANQAKGTISEVTKTARDAMGSVRSSIDQIKSTVGEVKNAVSGVTTNFKTAIDQARREIEEVKRTVVEPIVSTVDEVRSTIKQGTDNLISSVEGAITDAAGDILDFGSNIQGAIHDVSKHLPDKYKDKLAKYDKNFGADLIDRHVLGSLKTLEELRNSIGSSKLDANITKFLQNVSGREYPTATDSQGNPLFGYGNGTYDDLTKYYKAASKVSPCAKLDDDVTNYKNNKDYFDVMMQIAADKGLADLLARMYNCPESAMYVDKNTDKLLADQYPTAVKKGDTDTAITIAKAVGMANIKDPDPLTLLANSNYSDHACEQIEALRTNNNGKGWWESSAMAVEEPVEDEEDPPAATLNLLSLVSSDKIGDIDIIDAGLMFGVQPPNRTEFFNKYLGEGGVHTASLCNAAIMAYGAR